MCTDVNDVAPSAHYCVFFSVLLAADRVIISRRVKEVHCETSMQPFQTPHRTKSLPGPLSESSRDDLADRFNSLMIDSINNAAPLRSKKNFEANVNPRGEIWP